MHKKIFRGCCNIIDFIVFGGSFDPIHLGHLEIIDKLRSIYPNKKIIIIPTYQNPLKQNIIADDKLRLQWIKDLLENKENIIIEDYELKQKKPNFTYETVKYLLKAYNPKHIDLVIGEDNLDNLENWKNINKLKKMLNFLIISRNTTYNDKHNTDNYAIIKIDNSASSSEIRNNRDYQYVPKKIKQKVKEFYENNR